MCKVSGLYLNVVFGVYLNESLIATAVAGVHFLYSHKENRTKRKCALCTGLRLHCGARFIRRLIKTRFAQTLISRYPDKAVLLVSTQGWNDSYELSN